MTERSLSFDAALQDLASLIHRLSLAQTVPDAIGDEDPDRVMLEELAGQFSPEDLQLYYQIAIQGRADLGLAPDEQAGFAMTLLRMLAFAPAGEGAIVAAPRRAAAQQGVRASPAVAPVESKKNVVDGPWHDLVDQLGLTGMARMLAQHCELVVRDGARVELSDRPGHQRLLKGRSRSG